MGIATEEKARDLVIDQLSRRGAKCVHVHRAGRRPFIVATNDDRSRTVWLSVRSRASGTWQTSTDYGIIRRHKANETSYWIFVDLTKSHEKKFYVVPEWWIENDIYRIHHECIAKHGGKRKRTPDSKHHAIYEDRIRRWHDRWDLLRILERA